VVIHIVICTGSKTTMSGGVMEATTGASFEAMVLLPLQAFVYGDEVPHCLGHWLLPEVSLLY
jgi:hypothetical protein